LKNKPVAFAELKKKYEDLQRRHVKCLRKNETTRRELIHLRERVEAADGQYHSQKRRPYTPYEDTHSLRLDIKELRTMCLDGIGDVLGQ